MKDTWMPSEDTEAFLLAMKNANMVPHCPECGYKCFCPKIAQTNESRERGTLVLWCGEMGHWSGDVRDANWRLRS